MKVLVLGEHVGNKLASATLNTITAACELGDVIDLLLIGDNLQQLADESSAIGALNSVLLADAPFLEHQLAEDLSTIILSLAQNYNYILANASTFGKNVIPRVAALLDVMPISDVTAIVSDDTFERPIYAGSAILTVKNTEAIKLLTIRSTKFKAASYADTKCNILELENNQLPHRTKFIKAHGQAPGISLSDAKVIVAGGRGLGNKNEFDNLMQLIAGKLGAAIGASRAAVDAGFCANELQIGQTGKVVAPDLYLAFGISGAIQHIAGIKDSQTIIAINKDPNAPIFDIADYGIVGDLFSILPEMVEKL